MEEKSKALKAHEKWQGKIEIASRAKVDNMQDLAVAYTPGVAEPCLEIAKDVDLSYTYTRRGNLVAVITDGTAVLGLGDIGPEAGMPVMEGKCVLFKEFADVDAFPLCIRSKDTEEIINTVKLLGGSFGGINLEDISAPRCFDIEKRLKEEMDIPVFHDDQHGTAVVVGAALINALKIVGKKPEDIRVAISGAGAAALALTYFLFSLGVEDIVLTDIKGILTKDRLDMHPKKQEIADSTNKEGLTGGLKEAIVGADVFVGLSAANLLTTEMVKTMNKDAIIFAMANPVPEIYPEAALAGGARIVGTGRSDFPNQINNVLAFPGIFRGTLDVRASDINEEMNLAAAHAIAAIIPDEELSESNILPNVFDKEVVPAVAKAVAQAARDTGVARI